MVNSQKKRTKKEKTPSKKIEKTKHAKPKLDRKDNEILKKKEELMNKFLKNKFGSLYLDNFLLFALSLTYGFFLYIFTTPQIGFTFIIFIIICCSIISWVNYHDLIEDIDSVIKDLEILFGR